MGSGCSRWLDDAGPEQELGNADGPAGNAAEAQRTGNQADDGENDGPLDHAETFPSAGSKK